MIDQLQALIEDIISDHWMKLAWFVVAALGLGAIKRWRDKRKWRLRQFLERVNCSLNVIDDGVLKIRTLFETSLGEVPNAPDVDKQAEPAESPGDGELVTTSQS